MSAAENAARTDHASTPEPAAPASVRLGEAASLEAFARAWLDLLARSLEGVRAALLVLGPADRGPYPPCARWPEGHDTGPALAAAVERALGERSGAIHGRPEPSRGAPHDTLAMALLVDGQVHGAVGLELEPCSEEQLRRLVHQLQLGAGWMVAQLRRGSTLPAERLATVLGLLTSALEQPRFHAAATAVVTELAAQLGCHRVSIGFLRGAAAHVAAVSNSANFGKKSNLARAIGAAMDEALDQRAVLCWPDPGGEEAPWVTRAQAELGERHHSGAVCTVPLFEAGEALGGFVLERAGTTAFTPAEVELARQVAALVGPVLDAKRRDDRWIGAKVWSAFTGQLTRLFGPRHLGLKLSALATVLLLAFLALAEGDYRVTADATLEGAVQRALAAPIDGFVAEASARAGDRVAEGQVLARFDTRDLELERLKWRNQRERRLLEYTRALADKDRAQTRILGAQVAQAEAQLELLDEQLARAALVAPFDAVVVSGDLSQALGAPVSRGEVLFQLAPLKHYRVILQVDQREVARVKPGQRGEVALSGLPGKPLAMEVQMVTPVADASEGSNVFRVEARLDTATDLLRPGMEGVGKIHVERRKLLWIWSHKLVDWLRLWAWSWWP